MAVLAGTGTAAVFGYTKKKLSQKLDSQTSQDTVVISAAFADGKLLRELLDAIVELRQANTAQGDREVEATNRVNDAINRQNDTIQRLHDMLRHRLN